MKKYTKDEILLAVNEEINEANKIFKLKKRTNTDYIVIGIITQALKRLN